MERIEVTPELRKAFTKALSSFSNNYFEVDLFFSDNWHKQIAEHFFMAGRESVEEELETWRSPQPKPRRIELHLTIKNESDSSNPVTLEQVYTL